MESDCLGYNPAPTLSNYGTLKKLFSIWGWGDVKLRHNLSIQDPPGSTALLSVQTLTSFPGSGHGILDIIIQSYLIPITCTQENISS